MDLESIHSPVHTLDCVTSWYRVCTRVVHYAIDSLKVIKVRLYNFISSKRHFRNANECLCNFDTCLVCVFVCPKMISTTNTRLTNGFYLDIYAIANLWIFFVVFVAVYYYFVIQLRPTTWLHFDFYKNSELSNRFSKIDYIDLLDRPGVQVSQHLPAVFIFPFRNNLCWQHKIYYMKIKFTEFKLWVMQIDQYDSSVWSDESYIIWIAM